MNDNPNRKNPNAKNPNAKATGGKNPNGKAGGKKRSRPKNRGRKKSARFDPVKFWGDVEALPEPPRSVVTAADPYAIVQSLGRAPIPGHENASEHYFRLVYERAASLAFVLAAAGGLDGASDALTVED